MGQRDLRVESPAKACSCSLLINSRGCSIGQRFRLYRITFVLVIITITLCMCVITRNSALIELGETILPPPELFDSERCCSSLGSDQTMLLLPPPAEFDNVSRSSSTTDLPLPPPPLFFDDSAEQLTGFRLACLRSALTSEVSASLCSAFNVSHQLILIIREFYERRTQMRAIGWRPDPDLVFLNGRKRVGVNCEWEGEKNMQ